MKQKVTEVVAASLSAVFVGGVEVWQKNGPAPAKVSGWESNKLRNWYFSTGVGLNQMDVEKTPCQENVAKYQSALF